jgi:hypothetical protein
MILYAFAALMQTGLIIHIAVEMRTYSMSTFAFSGEIITSTISAIITNPIMATFWMLAARTIFAFLGVLCRFIFMSWKTFAPYEIGRITNPLNPCWKRCIVTAIHFV